MTSDELSTLKKRVSRISSSVKWNYIEKDSPALIELRRRLEKAVKSTRLLSYPEWVDGVTFHLPQINRGAPYTIPVDGWKGSDGVFVGEILCYLSMESFAKHGYLASALIVKTGTSAPGSGFFELAELLGLYNRIDERTDLTFWKAELDYISDPKTVSHRTLPLNNK